MTFLRTWFFSFEWKEKKTFTWSLLFFYSLQLERRKSYTSNTCLKWPFLTCLTCPSDFFAIKVTVPESGMTAGHLPMENSRVTKYILDRGAHVYAVLTSTNYCVSPLVQGGLEIPCGIEIHMPSTVKNWELVGIYEKYVDTLYYQREKTNIAGSFVESSAGIETMETNNSKGRESKKRKNNETTNASSSKDIRAFFEKRRTVSSTKKVDVPKNVVELSDDEWMRTRSDFQYNIFLDIFLLFSIFIICYSRKKK